MMLFVLKIGGAVFKNKKGFDGFRKIVEETAKPALVIVSAFANVTNSLLNIAVFASQGLERRSLKWSEAVFEEHRKFALSRIKNQDILDVLLDKIKEYNDSFNEIIESILLTKEYSPRIRDLVLSYGEKLAMAVIDAYLSDCNIKHTVIDAGDIIVTDDNFGEAKPLEKETGRNVNEILVPAMRRHRLVIMQGFVAKTSKGDVTTMGFESSNLTAVLMAKLMHLKKVTFWTDVCGVYNCDPAFVTKAKLIKNLIYDDAHRFGEAGLKLLYPAMIDYARENLIYLIFKSPFCKDKRETVIEPGKRHYRKPLIVASTNKTLHRIELITKADISGLLKIIQMMIDDGVLSLSYLLFKGNELIFISETNNSFSEYFKGYSYSREADAVSIITLFNVRFEKIKPLIVRKKGLRKMFPAPIELIDFNDDYVTMVIKERNTKSVLRFLSKHIME
jgi:aspartate kinase